MSPKELIEFEDDVSAAFEAKKIRGPIHLNSDSQAEPLIEIFNDIKRTDWVLSNWRSHWHALLHGVPRGKVMAEILDGRSMMLHFPEHRFMTSAIVGGMLPIACGLAAAGQTVWCFVGDMCESLGVFADAEKFSTRNGRVNWVIEDNGLSTNTPTQAAWGNGAGKYSTRWYKYERTRQHCGTENYVAF